MHSSILPRGKTPALTQTALRDSAVIQSAIGIADAKLNSARTWLIHVLRETQEAVKIAGELTTEQRMAIRQASTYAIHQAKEVVDVAYHEAGATAIFDANPFERRFRDVNTVTQQVQGRRSHFETIGQHLLGARGQSALGVKRSEHLAPPPLAPHLDGAAVAFQHRHVPANLVEPPLQMRPHPERRGTAQQTVIASSHRPSAADPP